MTCSGSSYVERVCWKTQPFRRKQTSSLCAHEKEWTRSNHHHTNQHQVAQKYELPALLHDQVGSKHGRSQSFHSTTSNSPRSLLPRVYCRLIVNRMHLDISPVYPRSPLLCSVLPKEPISSADVYDYLFTYSCNIILSLEAIDFDKSHLDWKNSRDHFAAYRKVPECGNYNTVCTIIVPTRVGCKCGQIVVAKYLSAFPGRNEESPHLPLLWTNASGGWKLRAADENCSSHHASRFVCRCWSNTGVAVYRYATSLRMINHVMSDLYRNWSAVKFVTNEFWHGND